MLATLGVLVIGVCVVLGQMEKRKEKGGDEGMSTASGCGVLFLIGISVVAFLVLVLFGVILSM